MKISSFFVLSSNCFRLDVGDEGDEDEDDWEDGVDQSMIDRRSTYEPSAREMDETRRFEQIMR